MSSDYIITIYAFVHKIIILGVITKQFMHAGCLRTRYHDPRECTIRTNI